MSNIAIFNFENSTVRTAIKNGNEPYFCLADVAEILEIPRSSDLLQIKKATRGQLDPKGVQKLTTPTKGGNQQITFVSEPNLYRVIFRSNKKEAVKFQNWVFDEVLPSIRKTGQYRHILSTAQQAQIQKVVRQKCKDNSTHYQTIYTALKDKFKVPSYKDILASEFDEALAFIVGFEFVSSYNLALIQNILADADHQTKKARDEFDQIMIAVHHLLEHMQNLQIRLDISERNIGALRTRFIA